MPLFSHQDNKLQRIRKVDFKYESEIQKLTEDNLEEIFDLEMVKSEFQLNNFRIDTLAFSKESHSFVIIEYKRGVNFSVIDQGFAYLSLLLHHRADFILEYKERIDSNLERSDVDWSQSKVIFVSPQFTTFQREAIKFKDLAFELWEINNYANGTVLFNQIKSPEVSESIKTVTQNSKVVQKVDNEIDIKTEEDHLKETSEDLQELYRNLRSRILKLDSNIEIKPFVFWISFKIKSHIIDIALQKTQIKLWLNLKKDNLKDERKLAKDVSNVGHWGVGDYELTLKSESDLNYIMTLIEQSYKINSEIN